MGLGLASQEVRAEPEPGRAVPFQVAQRASCPEPWSWSQGLRRCVCVQEGHALVRGACVAVTAQRVGREAPAEAAAATAAPVPRVQPEGIEFTAAFAQECLKEAGYLRASVEPVMTPEAWTAFWYFKRDHRVGRTPDGIRNRKAQSAMLALCPRARAAAVGTSEPAAEEPAAAEVPLEAQASRPQQGVAPVPSGSAEPAGEEQPAETPAPPADAARPAQPPAGSAPDSLAVAALAPAPQRLILTPHPDRPELACLPADLRRLLFATYGERSGVAACSGACVPAPPGLSEAERKDYEARHGVRWCTSCLELSSVLPLDDVLLIERGTGVQLCTRPDSPLALSGAAGRALHQPYAKVRGLFRPYARGSDHENDIAVVIGNRTYGNGHPLHATAHNSAGAIYALLTEHLGYRPENVIDLRDASLEAMRAVFEPDGDRPGRLAMLLKARPGAAVLIYFAGHGTSSVDQREAYLLPVDAVPYREDRTGYALSALYASLERLQARSALVLLEASFARDVGSFVFAPNLAELVVPMLPSQPLPGMTVLAAATGDQKTLADPHYGVGLFTRYLVEALAGQADLPPLGNGDGRVEAVELHVYVAHMVRLAARKSYGLLQGPQMSHAANGVVSRIQAQVR